LKGGDILNFHNCGFKLLKSEEICPYCNEVVFSALKDAEYGELMRYSRFVKRKKNKYFGIYTMLISILAFLLFINYSYLTPFLALGTSKTTDVSWFVLQFSLREVFLIGLFILIIGNLFFESQNQLYSKKIFTITAINIVLYIFVGAYFFLHYRLFASPLATELFTNYPVDNLNPRKFINFYNFLYLFQCVLHTAIFFVFYNSTLSIPKEIFNTIRIDNHIIKNSNDESVRKKTRIQKNVKKFVLILCFLGIFLSFLPSRVLTRDVNNNVYGSFHRSLNDERTKILAFFEY